MLFSPKLNPSSYLLQFFSSSNLSLIQSHRYIGQTQSILLISNRFKGFWLLYVCVWNFGWWWRECVLGNTSLGKRLVKGTLQKSNSLQILFLANRLPSKSSTSLVPVASTSLFRFLHFESTLFYLTLDLIGLKVDSSSYTVLISRTYRLRERYVHSKSWSIQTLLDYMRYMF